MRKFERIWLNMLRGEVFLFRLTIVVSTFLVLAQSALFTNDARPYLSQVDYFEGQPLLLDGQTPSHSFSAVENVVNTREILRKGQTITIHMVKPSSSKEAIVTVNGQTVGDFYEGFAEFTVYSGDYVEIDATKLAGDGQFIVHTNSPNLKNLNGLVLESKHNIITIGKIKFMPTN